MRKKPNEYVWQKFNRLTVIWTKKVEVNWRFKTHLICKCDCGNEIIRDPRTVYSWRIKWCGCIKKELDKNFWWQNKTHWMSFKPIYAVYRAMVNRCNNPNDRQYHLYWWRWIKCLWENYQDFHDDMYESYLKHKEEHWWNRQTTIDREDNNWPYCKSNCKRKTQKEQAANRRIDNMVWNT